MERLDIVPLLALPAGLPMGIFRTSLMCVEC